MTVETRRSTAPARLHGDIGSAVIEASIVAPVLTLLIMAIFEYGLLLRDYLNTSAAVADGAKYGAIQGPDATTAGALADQTVITVVRQNLGSLPVNVVERVVVFKAGPSSLGAPLAQVPAACKTATTSQTGCNVYLVPQSFVEIEKPNPTYFECPTGGTPAGNPACGWDPETRKNGPLVSDIEYLGVYLKLNRSPVTGLFGVPTTLEVAAIVRLEPGVLS